jgi:hypothetical protein
MSRDELILAMSNRATSRCYSKWMLPAQVGGAACILLWPLGAVAGSLGIVALVAMGAGTALAGLAMADQESSRIAQGDRNALAQYLTDDDLGEFKALAAAAATAPPKPMGAAPAPKESGSTTQTPTPGSNADAAPVPYAPIKLDPDCPHFLLLAGSREGKTNALRCLLDGHARVNYVSTKSTDQVPAHWEGYVIGGTPEGKGLQLQWLLAHWGAKLDAHADGTDTQPEWFVFDEAIQIQTYAKRSKVKGLAESIAGLQVEIATQGAAIGAYGVMLAQTKNAGPLGIDLDLLQQNFRMVIPLKSKRRLALSVIEKMGGLRLNPDQRDDILSNPSRYLQLWLGEDEDIYFDVLPEFKGKTKPLIKCPILDTDTATQQATEQAEPKALHQRIIEYLAGHGDAKTAREIRNACTRPTDIPRASTDDVKGLLESMILAGKITRWTDTTTDRYQATGTGGGVGVGGDIKSL